MTNLQPLSPERIEQAQRLIDPVFLNSQIRTFSGPGLQLVAKDETNNPIRSFKGRGTSFYLASEGSGAGGLVTASAGNFGQGLAYNASRVGRPLTVFSSVNANPLKIEAMKRLNATVILEGDDFDAAKDFAKHYAQAHELTFVEDGASASIAEGAGTIASELTSEVSDLDAIYVPLGNGALAAGVGCWFKAHSPKTRVIAVAARGAPCMVLSWKSGALIPTPQAKTIADGIAVRNPVPEAIHWLKGTIDDVLLVDDDQILAAMRFAHATWCGIVEPAGAAGLAGILANREDWRGGRFATVLCGANITDRQVHDWLPDAAIRS